MAKTAQYSPENPRDCNPNDPILKSPLAPHETAGVLRIHRAGHKGADIMKMFKLRGTRLMKQMQRAMDDESRAHAAGLKIHDALITIPKEKR